MDSCCCHFRATRALALSKSNLWVSALFRRVHCHHRLISHCFQFAARTSQFLFHLAISIHPSIHPSIEPLLHHARSCWIFASPIFGSLSFIYLPLTFEMSFVGSFVFTPLFCASRNISSTFGLNSISTPIFLIDRPVFVVPSTLDSRSAHFGSQEQMANNILNAMRS